MMKKRIAAIVGALLLVVAVLAPALIAPVMAVDLPPQAQVPAEVREQLPPGWERADAHTTHRQIGIEHGAGPNGSDLAIYEALISTLPQVMPDGVTAIDTHWYLLTDDSGQQWFETGTNLLKGRVLGGRVSVEDGNGKLAVWDSRIVIGGVSVEGGTPSITDDPFNENYQGNTLMWDYGTYKAQEGEGTLVRYLRVIEGVISELWYISKAPADYIILDIDRQEESGFQGNIEWISGWDSKGRSIEIGTNALGMFIILPDDLKGLEFPVWLDPTATIGGSAYDGDVYNYGAVGGGDYAAVQAAASGEAVHTTGSTSNIGQNLYGSYTVYRCFLYFNTLSLADDITITSAEIQLRRCVDETDTDFYVTVQSGMPTYPHMPAVLADYNKSYYSGNGGTFHTSNLMSGYNNIVLSSTGMSWINKSGYTKFCLRSDREIAATTPTGFEDFTFYTYEMGSSYAPRLYVVYTLPATIPTVTTKPATGIGSTYATANAELTDDGNEECSTRFQYGLSTSYPYATGWLDGYVTDDDFSRVITGLSPGTVYYFRGQAANSAGTGTGSGLTFLTLPERPYSFVVDEGDTQVDLTSWVKGEGSTKTMIRRSTSSYPTSPTDGTQVYFDTGTTVVDGGLTNGVTYYYSAWGYTSSGGLSQYSSTRATFTAEPEAPAVATVVTNPATSVAATSANLNLELTSLGGFATADVSFEYGLTVAYGSTAPALPATLSDVGTYQTNIAGLAPATPYHFRARAQNGAGWAYGADRTFTTGAACAPTITTSAASAVQLNAAQLNGIVTSDGDSPPVTVWFDYGLTVAYGFSTPVGNGLETGSTFYYGLSDLEHSTMYHFRAVGENAEGIAYGMDGNFTTSSPTAPTAGTLDAVSIGAHQATLRGQVLSDGGVAVEVSFEYGLDTSYGTNTSWVEGYSTGQSFSALVVGLDTSTEYHFRARVRNDGGTGYGTDELFTTIFTAPTGFSATATSYTTVQLVWTSQSDQTYIRYKQGGYPIDRQDGIAAYFGPSSSAAVSGLEAGTTYYFRAWSWAEGDIWAGTTAAALATTLAGAIYGEDDDPPGKTIPAPDDDDFWSSNISSARLTKMPGYGAFEAARASYEIPEGTFYFVLAMFITSLVFLAGYLLGKKNPLVGLLSGAFALGICAWLGMASPFIVIIYVAFAGGLAFLLTRRGSEA